MDGKNPYLDVSSDQLARACSQAAHDVSANVPRDRQQRLELAERVRLLLMASALRIVPAGSWFARPEVARRPDDFFSSLRADHLQRLRKLRYRALLHAAEHRLGAAAHSWIRDACLGADRVYDLALASEAGLESALQHLDLMSSRDR